MKSFLKALIGSVLIVLALNTCSAHALHVSSPQAHIDIDTQKVIYIEGDINQAQVFKVAEQGVKTLMLPGDTVVMINSRGGDFVSGDAIINMLLTESIQANNRFICVVQHEADSMAFNILSFCNVRLSLPKAHMTVHKLAYVIDAKHAAQERLTAINLRKMADDLDLSDQPYRVNNALAMGISLKDYDLFADNETCWRAETLLKMGYFHGIAVVSP